MTEQNYSNRELDMKFKELTGKMDEVMVSINNVDKKNREEHLQNSEKLEKIQRQTNSFGAWRLGISMCMGIIVFIVIPLLVYSFQLSEQNLKQQILLELKN